MDEREFFDALNQELASKKQTASASSVAPSSKKTLQTYGTGGTIEHTEDLHARLQAIMDDDQDDSTHAQARGDNSRMVSIVQLNERMGNDRNFVIKQIKEAFKSFSEPDIGSKTSQTPPPSAEERMKPIFSFLDAFGVGQIHTLKELRTFIEHTPELKDLWKKLSPPPSSTTTTKSIITTRKSSTNGGGGSAAHKTNSNGTSVSGLKLTHDARPQVDGQGRTIGYSSYSSGGGGRSASAQERREAQAMYERIEKQSGDFADQSGSATSAHLGSLTNVPLNVAFVRDNVQLTKILLFIQLRIVDQIGQNRYATGLNVNVDVMLGSYPIWNRICQLFDADPQYRARISTVRTAKGDADVLIIQWG